MTVTPSPCRACGTTRHEIVHPKHLNHTDVLFCGHCDRPCTAPKPCSLCTESDNRTIPFAPEP